MHFRTDLDFQREQSRDKNVPGQVHEKVNLWKNQKNPAHSEGYGIRAKINGFLNVPYWGPSCCGIQFSAEVTHKKFLGKN